MGLSHELISQFAKLVTENKKQNTESTVYGTVKTDANGNKYVQLDGSDQLTPLTEENRPTVDSTTTNTKEGDRVSVLIKNHTATVTGNISSPSVRDEDFGELDEQVSEIKQFDIVIAEQVQANEGYIKELRTDKLSVGDFNAAKAEIDELISEKATITDLNAANAEITNLKTTKIDAEVANATYATIENLKATDAKVGSLDAEKASIEELDATNANIEDLRSTKLDTTWANIEIADITKAIMKDLYAKTGLIESVTAEDLTVTDYLIGVKIKGDLIEANTLKADRLWIRGEGGLYHEINLDAGVVATEEVTDEMLQNGLHGSTIIADTVTADKIKVSDLVAFGATIGGFEITRQSINTIGKDVIDSPIEGIYLDNKGQIVFGDGDNFFKYVQTEDGLYRLSIGMKSDSGQTLGFDRGGLTVRDTNERNVEIATTITNKGVNVTKDDAEVLTANDEGVKATDLHATTYLKIGSNSRFEDYSNGRTACFWIGGNN